MGREGGAGNASPGRVGSARQSSQRLQNTRCAGKEAAAESAGLSPPTPASLCGFLFRH